MEETGLIFFGDSMIVNNLIIVEGGTGNDIKKALCQWIDLYASKLPDDFSFKVSMNHTGAHLIQADAMLDNDLFFFLVNYLDCPKGIKYDVKAKGFAIGKKNDILNGKKLLVYISSADKEGDNVFVATSENENFKISFSGKITKVEDNTTFALPTELNFDNFEIIRSNIQQEERRKSQKNLTSVGKRFKVLSVIFGVLFTLAHIVLFTLGDKETFQTLIVIFGGGIWLWFFADYKMLRYNKFYLRCLGLAVLYAGYAGFLGSYFKNIAIHIVTLYALALLIVQKPLRKIYLVLFKKEPKIDRSGTFEDLCYTVVLFIGSILFSMLAMIKGSGFVF